MINVASDAPPFVRHILQGLPTYGYGFLPQSSSSRRMCARSACVMLIGPSINPMTTSGLPLVRCISSDHLTNVMASTCSGSRSFAHVSHETRCSRFTGRIMKSRPHLCGEISQPYITSCVTETDYTLYSHSSLSENDCQRIPTHQTSNVGFPAIRGSSIRRKRFIAFRQRHGPIGMIIGYAAREESRRADSSTFLKWRQYGE